MSEVTPLYGNELQLQIEQRIAYTGEAINKKVYALYGLSAEEVGVVEWR